MYLRFDWIWSTGGWGGGGSRLHAGLHCRKCGVKGEQFSHTNKPSWVFEDIKQSLIFPNPGVFVDILMSFNPQTPDGVYKPPLVYCRMGFINTSPFPTLHLGRNAAKVSESLKMSDERMAELYWAVFIHKQPLEGFPTLLSHLSPRSLPYAEPIFGWLPVYVRWKRKGSNCILCFFTSFLTISKREKIFIFIFKLAENSPAVG